MFGDGVPTPISHVFLTGVPEVAEDGAFPLLKLSGVQDVLGVEDLLDALHQGDGGFAVLALQEFLLGIADAMLAGNQTAQFHGLLVHPIKNGGEGVLPVFLIQLISADIDMDALNDFRYKFPAWMDADTFNVIR